MGAGYRHKADTPAVGLCSLPLPSPFMEREGGKPQSGWGVGEVAYGLWPSPMLPAVAYGDGAIILAIRRTQWMLCVLFA